MVVLIASLTIMLLGMGAVFVFLSLLAVIMTWITRLWPFQAPAPAPISKAPPAAPAMATTVAAIQAAITVHEAERRA